MIPTAPLRLRNRLAEMILAALHDPERRRALDALAGDDARRLAWLGNDERDYAALTHQRMEAAAAALRGLPLGRHDPDLDEALEAAATLFDAGLGFEVHELLESCWQRESGERREVLRGLIQIAVGYQHRANGNLAGARALLAEGAARLAGRTLEGVALDDFARAVRASLAAGAGVPRFPRRH